MRLARVLLAVLPCLLACAEGSDRMQVARETVRGNLEKACRGQAACLQVIEIHFAGCFEEYLAATERDGEANPRIMAACMNRRAGKEWFSWREK